MRAGHGQIAAQDDHSVIEADRRVLKKMAQKGMTPHSYAYRIPFVMAHAFLYSVDLFSTALKTLCEYDDMPANVHVATREFAAKFPALRELRNSALHFEDRLRFFWLGAGKKSGKRINPRPFLGLGNLEGDKLCYTIGDGIYQGLPISLDVLIEMGNAANKILASFRWTGRPRVIP